MSKCRNFERQSPVSDPGGSGEGATAAATVSSFGEAKSLPAASSRAFSEPIRFDDSASKSAELSKVILRRIKCEIKSCKAYYDKRRGRRKAVSPKRRDDREDGGGRPEFCGAAFDGAIGSWDNDGKASICVRRVNGANRGRRPIAATQTVGFKLAKKFNCLDLTRLHLVAPIQRYKHAEVTIAVVSKTAELSKVILRRITQQIKFCKELYDRRRGRRVAPQDADQSLPFTTCWCYSGTVIVDAEPSGSGDHTARIHLNSCVSFPRSLSESSKWEKERVQTAKGSAVEIFGPSFEDVPTKEPPI